MRIADAHIGDLVQVDRMMPWPGILAGPDLLRNRRHDARGIVVRVHTSEGGETGVVWVRHGGNKVAPYLESELILLGVKAPD